jgi:WD40 repeat protein
VMDVEHGHEVFQLRNTVDSKLSPIWAVAALCTDLDTYGITGNFHGNMDIYSLSSGNYLRRLSGHIGLTFSIVGYDGYASHGLHPIIISGSLDLTIRVWDLKTGDQISQLKGHSNNIIKLCVLDIRDGIDPLLISASLDKTIIIWDLISLKQLRTLRGHSGAISSVSVCTQSSCSLRYPVLVSYGADKKLISWSTSASEKLATWQYLQSPSFAAALYPIYKAPQAQVNATAASTTPRAGGHLNSDSSSYRTVDDVILITGQEDPENKGVAAMFSLKSGELVRAIQGQVHGSPIWCISVCEEYDLMATCAFADEFACIWRLSTGQLLEKVLSSDAQIQEQIRAHKQQASSSSSSASQGPLPAAQTSFRRYFWSVKIHKISQTGELVLVCGTSDSMIYMWKFAAAYASSEHLSQRENWISKPAEGLTIPSDTVDETESPMRVDGLRITPRPLNTQQYISNPNLPKNNVAASGSKPIREVDTTAALPSKYRSMADTATIVKNVSDFGRTLRRSARARKSVKQPTADDEAGDDDDPVEPATTVKGTNTKPHNARSISSTLPDVSPILSRHRKSRVRRSSSDESQNVSVDEMDSADLDQTVPEPTGAPKGASGRGTLDYSSILTLAVTLSSDKAAVRGLCISDTRVCRPDIGAPTSSFTSLVIMCACRNGYLYFINELGQLLFKIGNVGEGVDAVITFDVPKSNSSVYVYGTLSGNIKVLSRNKPAQINSLFAAVTASQQQRAATPSNSSTFNEMHMLCELSYTAGVKSLHHLDVYSCPYLISGHMDGSVLVWDLRRRALVHAFEGNCTFAYFVYHFVTDDIIFWQGTAAWFLNFKRFLVG